ncbi:MAG TPA: signal recognition particle protein, partial [Kiritimatiellia bacterium]|nr:signal recognition particle protein [Kiritimatiellia bacterium]
VLTLVERAEQAMSEKEARQLEEKLRKNQFTLEDFKDQLLQLQKMGSLESLLSMLPGMGQAKALKDLDLNEDEMKHTLAIINSMTPEERRNHQVISGSRRQRIARGSGTTIQDVNSLLKRYVQARKMLGHLTKGGGMMPGGMMPGGMGMPGGGGGGKKGAQKSAKVKKGKKGKQAKKPTFSFPFKP